MVGAEASPFVKTGGLGDVLGSLPAALAQRGDEVAVALPRYRVASDSVGAERSCRCRSRWGRIHLRWPLMKRFTTGCAIFSSIVRRYTIGRDLWRERFRLPR